MLQRVYCFSNIPTLRIPPLSAAPEAFWDWWGFCCFFASCRSSNPACIHFPLNWDIPCSLSNITFNCLLLFGNRLFYFQAVWERKIENKKECRKKGFLCFYSVCMFLSYSTFSFFTFFFIVKLLINHENDTKLKLGTGEIYYV